jgi:hypothetical protein
MAGLKRDLYLRHSNGECERGDVKKPVIARGQNPAGKADGKAIQLSKAKHLLRSHNSLKSITTTTRCIALYGFSDSLLSVRSKE